MTFTPVNADISGRRTALLSLSLVFHGVLLGWLLYPPTLKVLAPSSVAAGVSGGSVTTLYWSTHEKTTNDLPGTARLEHRGVRKRLIWKEQAFKIRRTQPPEPARGPTEAQSQSPGSSLGNPSPPAGTPYGSQGSAFGDEVRPALPINAYDPVVDPNELPGHVEGSIVVEITIDDRGNIVQKTVLQSLGAAIDNKVLAALENWHFRPATRNGVAIPSKQDVYYHFKPQG
ncbi:MAG TPA: TonB family protein [Terriglobales bacterium]|jgi:TonB family protein|nr:TonB family protein [Terriglobales bacterium]